MRYLIIHKHEGKQTAFYTDWYDYENNYNEDASMIVFDLISNIFTTDGINWQHIEQDHL